MFNRLNKIVQLNEAGLLGGLEKFYEEVVRVKAASPKLAVWNTGLMTALLPYSHSELRARGDLWGHVVESAVGAHLMATAKPDEIDILFPPPCAPPLSEGILEGRRFMVKSSTCPSPFSCACCYR